MARPRPVALPVAAAPERVARAWLVEQLGAAPLAAAPGLAAVAAGDGAAVAAALLAAVADDAALGSGARALRAAAASATAAELVLDVDALRRAAVAELVAVADQALAAPLADRVALACAALLAAALAERPAEFSVTDARGASARPTGDDRSAAAGSDDGVGGAGAGSGGDAGGPASRPGGGAEGGSGGDAGGLSARPGVGAAAEGGARGDVDGPASRPVEGGARGGARDHAGGSSSHRVQGGAGAGARGDGGGPSTRPAEDVGRRPEDPRAALTAAAERLVADGAAFGLLAVEIEDAALVPPGALADAEAALRDALPEGCRLAPDGPGSLLVLVCGRESRATARALTAAVAAAASDRGAPLRAAAGVARHPEDGDTPGALLAHADAQLFAARAEGLPLV